MEKRLFFVFGSVLLAVSAFAAPQDPGKRNARPPSLSSSFPSWTEIEGKVIDVRPSSRRLTIREDGADALRELTITEDVRIYDKRMMPVPFKKVRKGDIVILRNNSTDTPAPAPVPERRR